MEFEEIFTSPFTTQTTCYSCGRKQIGSDSVDLQFATENHVLSVRIPENDTVKTSCRSLPRDAAQMTCVGYDSWEEEEESNEEYTTVFHMEAMALIDPEVLDNENNEASSDANLHRPSTLPVDRGDDASSAVTPTRSSTQGLRRVSSFATATTATSTTNNPPLSHSGSYHRKSQSELSKGSIITSDSQQSLHTIHNSSNQLNTTIETTSAALVEAPQTKSKARLVLKQDRYSIRKSLLKMAASDSAGCDKDDHDDTSNDHAYRRQLRQSSFALLDFRPLCPCIAQWNGDSYIWVGSADDAMLRLYAPCENDPRSLIPILLPEEHFFVHSPVMGLDFLSCNGRHTLAVACQDGTIQLITWKDSAMPKSIFGDLCSQKVIVDGPLVCLKLDNCNQRVMVGSLCGFVCQLHWEEDSKLWEGPHMVVQDVHANNMEESVLAVDVWKNYVAIGTHSGRCLLYATHDGQNYFLVWQAVLPYPVHDMCILTTNEETLKIAVTTRRSFHVFSKIHGEQVVWNERPKRKEKYSSEMGKTKLESMLKEIRKANQQLDLETQSSVREIVQDLLVKVETASTNKHTPNEGANVETINNLMDRVEEYVALKPPETTTPSAADAPHWEYSSSDEEEEEEGTAENEKEESGQKETKKEAEC